MKRFVRFFAEVYSPGLHLAFTAAWFVALQRLLFVVLLPKAGPPPFSGPALIATVHVVSLGFVVLFFLRIVDEWKDEDYDREFHPSRPLSRGLVARRDLKVYLGAIGAIALAGAAALGRTELAVTAADMAWAVALIGIERISSRVREGMFLNLALTYPVNVALSVLVYVVVLRQTHAEASLRGLVPLLAFAFAFLHFETLRKIAWPEVARPNERLYSRTLGPRLAIALATAFALAAVGTVYGVLASVKNAAVLVWLAPSLVPSVIALVRFLSRPGQRVALRPFGMAFLTLFYVGVVVITASD